MPNLAEIARSQACAASTVTVDVPPLRLAPLNLPKPSPVLRVLAHVATYAVCSVFLHLAWST